jgi:hypothetical protein
MVAQELIQDQAANSSRSAGRRAASVIVFYLCPRCFEAAERPTPCPRCGGERATCRPGPADDPRRKPIIGAAGDIQGHAPVWWLQAAGMRRGPEGVFS